MFNKKSELNSFIREKKDESIKYLMSKGIYKYKAKNLLNKEYLITRLDTSILQNPTKLFPERLFKENPRIDEFIEKLHGGVIEEEDS